MSNFKLSKRQNLLLLSIVEEYVQFGQPVSSKVIIDKYIKNCSSATIRSEMVKLEKMNLLEKSHQSSGRIPSLEGFKFYNENLKITNYDSNAEIINLKKRIRSVLSKRYSSIEETIENSIKIINEVTNLTSVVSKSNENELLKRIDLIPISETKATVIVVSSSGLINNNLITLTENVSIEDISVCIRVLNDRLIDTPLININEKLKEVAPIIQSMVQNYEFFLQEFLNKIFDKNLKSTLEVSGSKNIVMHKEFTEREKVIKILDLLEDTNIWKQIALEQSKTGKTQITFGKDIGTLEDLAVASTSIIVNDQKHTLSLVGSTRMNYSKVIALLNILKDEIEESYKDE